MSVNFLLMQHRLPRWILPFAAIAAGQLALWWIVYLAVGGELPHLSQLTQLTLVAVALGSVAYFLFDLARMMVRREPDPIGSLTSRISTNRGRLIGGFVGCLLWSVLMSSVSGLKSAIPLVSPYWADPALAELDRLLFFTDPWRISHFLLGWATKPIDVIYACWHPVQILCIVSLFFARESQRTNRAIVCYGLLWLILGAVGWTASSAGPLFYDHLFGGNTFAPLIAALKDGGATLVLRTSGYLVDAYSTHRSGIGTGLSAMPSLHVAIAFWVALVFRKWWAWTFFALIWIGSVHLGWHYFTDGLVSVIAAASLWRFVVFPRPSRDRVEAARRVEV